MAPLRIIKIYHIEFRLDLTVALLVIEQMVVGYHAEIRTLEVIDISAVTFLYHLFDKGVYDGIRLARTGSTQHDGGSERVDDVNPTLVPFLLIVESGRQVNGVLVVH